MSDQIFYLFSAVLLGLVIGALIMYFASGKGSNSAKTVELEEKLKTYQEDVVQHFEKTADLVDDLTQSYKKVFDHLGNSARELMTDEQLQLQMEKRKGQKVTLEFLPLVANVSQEELFEELVEEVESQEVDKEEIQEVVEEIALEKNDSVESDLEEASEESTEESPEEVLAKDTQKKTKNTVDPDDENSYT